MRLSMGATTASEGGIDRGAVVGLVSPSFDEFGARYRGIGTPWPPSAVLTVTSGDAVTMISSVELSSASFLVAEALSEECKRLPDGTAG
jgi:hypothetical protein